MTMKKLHVWATAAMLLAWHGTVPAQDVAAHYPTQPVKLWVPWPPGGGERGPPR